MQQIFEHSEITPLDTESEGTSADLWGQGVGVNARVKCFWDQSRLETRSWQLQIQKAVGVAGRPGMTTPRLKKLPHLLKLA